MAPFANSKTNIFPGILLELMPDISFKRQYLFIALAVCLCAVPSCKNRTEENLQTIDLLKDLQTAEFIVDTRIVDVGKPVFREYLMDGWSSDRKEPGGTTSAVVDSRTATAFFYCHKPVDRILTVRCRTEPGSAESQSFNVSINGKKIRGRTVSNNYREFNVPVPANHFVPGRNEIQFILNVLDGKNRTPGISFDYFAFLQKDRTGKREQVSLATARAREIFSTTIEESDSNNVVSAPLKSAMYFYFEIPTGASLNLKFGFSKQESRGMSARFVAEIEPEDSSKVTLIQETVSTGLFSSGSETISLPLDRFAGKIVRLTLGTEPVSGKDSPQSVYWASAKISHPGSPVQAAPVTQSQKKPNIIIYLIDALRADRLEPYNYPKPTSPHIKEFASESVVFENAYAQTAWTRASVATIMTGLYPSSHLTESRLDTLPDFLPTIASELKTHGYATHAFATNGNVSNAFGFHRQFDSYRQFGERPNSKEIHVQSNELFGHVKTFLEQGIPQPAFLYVHATDPHEPYTPAPFALNIPEGCNPDDIRMYRPHIGKYGKKAFDDNDLACIQALYDSEVLKADYYFGQFIDLLKHKGLYDNSVVILTADHGEEFLEHGFFKHGQTLHEAEIRIPLIVHFPGRQHAKKRIKGYARHMDILPTILDIVSRKVPPGVQGTTLMPRLNGDFFPGPVFGELTLDTHEGKYLILDRFKLLEQKRFSGVTRRLFDIVADPLEKTELSNRYSVRFGYMKRLLNEWTDSQQKRKALLKKPHGAVLDKDTEEALKALGYLQ